MRRRVAILMLTLIVALAGAGSGHTEGSGGPRTLIYVESSEGLIPPQMEGGRTEVEMGDVNGDGWLDLVSIGDHGSPYVNTNEHGVMVWFGDGTGTWEVWQYGDFGYGGVALGDVNGDGLLDVGYGMHHDYSGTDLGDQILEVALGDGTGLAWTPWDDGLAQNGETWGMFGTDFADVDNDGDLDVGSISFGCCAGVHIYLNQGDGTWMQAFGFLEGNSDMHFVFGDVNGDGNADIAVSHQAGTVYLGDGAGGFSLEDGNLPPIGPYATRPGVSLGDVNGDGHQDLAFCNPNGGSEVWSRVAPGTWESLSAGLPAAGLCEATQLYDMDVDGHLDLAAFGYGQLRVWGGDGAGNWSEIAAFTTPAPGYLSAFRVGGDADHNGFPDIVLVADEGGWPNDQNHARFFKEASPPGELSITPVYPRGGESLAAGGVAFIDWLSAVPAGGPGEVSVELSVDGPGGPWVPIAGGLVNGGRFQWHLAADLPSTDTAYLRYTLAVDAEIRQAVTPEAFRILGGPGVPAMHVQGIHMRGWPGDSKALVLGLVRIVDGEGQAVGGATMTVRWALPGGRIRFRQGSTSAAGWARLWLLDATPGGGGPYQLCVVNVVGGGYEYRPEDNVETCDQVEVP